MSKHEIVHFARFSHRSMFHCTLWEQRLHYLHAIAHYLFSSFIVELGTGYTIRDYTVYTAHTSPGLDPQKTDLVMMMMMMSMTYPYSG